VSFYTYSALIFAIHDGDSCSADIDLGFDVHTIQHLRLLGCNARELSQPGGKEALANLAAVLSGKTVTVRSVKPDKFGGRYDAAVTLPDGTDLVTQLIADQWAVPWTGQGLKPVPPWPRTVA
jgi:endonuclease YncB( thermonuclease family)